MPNSLSQFRANFFGVRTNRFMVNFSYPAGIADDLDLNLVQTIYCKASQTPSSAIGVIPIMWQGRTVKFSGERVYGDWSIVVYEASGAKNSHNLKAGFERWIEAMDTRDTHVVNYNYVTNWDIYYDDSSGQGTGASQEPSSYSKHIKMINCFPVEMSPLDLSYDSENQFAEFTVTMAYDFWEPQTKAAGA